MAGLLALGLAFVKPIADKSANPDEIVTVDALRAEMDAGTAIVLDARPAGFFEQSHIPGALNLNEDDWEGGLGGFLEVWSPELEVVVYCDSRACQASEHVAERIREELGIEHVRILEGGWEAWQKAGQPVTSP